jgi:hypothetical protein
VTNDSPFASGLSAGFQASDARMIQRGVLAHPKARRAERSVRRR